VKNHSNCFNLVKINKKKTQKKKMSKIFIILVIFNIVFINKVITMNPPGSPSNTFDSFAPNTPPNAPLRQGNF
jgi:hypothetical protein